MYLYQKLYLSKATKIYSVMDYHCQHSCSCDNRGDTKAILVPLALIHRFLEYHQEQIVYFSVKPTANLFNE